MPEIPKQVQENEVPRFKSLSVGTELRIVKVELGKTEKNQYECATVTLIDGSRFFGTDKGVVNALRNATEQYGFEFAPKDPLIATISTYTDKFNKERISLV